MVDIIQNHLTINYQLMPTVLSIETSCDETSVAIVNKRKVLSQVTATQISIHAVFGGVVPEIASREHLETVNYVIAQALTESGLDWPAIDGVAVTVAPGLVGSLLIGMTAAKTLAILHNKPLIGVHHLEGHIYANYLSEPDLQPPFLSLLVSGGHTSLIHVKDCGLYEQLGETRDDAAGEAFDKVARLLKLPYPGGPEIDRLAAQGDPLKYPLPEGNVSLPTGGFHRYDSSFSGVKTAVLRLVQKLEQTELVLPVADIAASFQQSVARALTKRVINCALDYGLTTITVGGGVAANSCLRQHLQAAGVAQGWRVIFPPLKFCTDNAAMIGCAAADHLERGHISSLDLAVQSRLPITEVMKLYEQKHS
jgi:N6-L-threonylcarbamoyladenine synthase